MSGKLTKLIKLADMLDNAGLFVYADQIDQLLKNITSEPTIKRFWAKTDKETAAPCWLWNGAKDKYGYGVVRINKRNYLTHKVAWMIANNQLIPKGQVIRHTCHKRNCVNPEHLITGSQLNNIDDRVKSNRSARGEQNGRTKLTQRDIRMIKVLKGLGWTETDIAQLLDVSRSAVANVLHNRSWNWVSD